MEKPSQSKNNSNGSVEVANKGVTSNLNGGMLEMKKSETIILLGDGADTTSTENNTHDSNHSISDETQHEYYRLASRNKFQGKSPSKLEFQLIRKPSTMSKGSRHGGKKTVKGTVDFNSRAQDVCSCRSGTLINNKNIIKNDLNSSLGQKIRHFFETRPQTGNQGPTDDVQIFIEENIDGDAKTKNQDRKVIKYNFEHGCPEFYKTFDCPPHLISDVLAEQTFNHATRFWAEMFGFINIGVTFFVTFLMQFYRFILYATFRTLIVGFLQITSDYFLKPMFAVIFNGFLQPPLLFTQNILISCGNVLQPISNCLNNFLTPLCNLMRSIRFIEINHQHYYHHDEKREKHAETDAMKKRHQDDVKEYLV